MPRCSPCQQVHTLFPALHTEAGIKGGVLLLQLEPPAGMPAGGVSPLRLAVSCTDRWGRSWRDTEGSFWMEEVKPHPHCLAVNVSLGSVAAASPAWR